MVPASARKAIFTAAHALRTSNVKKILFPAHCYPTCPRSVERKKVNIYEIKGHFVVVEMLNSGDFTIVAYVLSNKHYRSNK